MPTPTVFISYSHKDEDWKDRLVTHLGVLEEEGFLWTWNDRKIGAGDEWLEEIRKAMDEARIAIFLVSANSLTSKFILRKEIPRLLELRAREGMTIYPVICEDCLWQEVPWLAKLQARPLDGRPLESFRGSRLNSELVKIAKEVLEIIREPLRLPDVRRTETPQVVSIVPALFQLPAPPADFTGREEDLASLLSALPQGSAGGILGLQGMSGIGKTTLALKLAEELIPLYPDAQFYLDLKGTNPAPLTAAQAMAHVIRSYYPQVVLPNSDAELSGLYRSVLQGKRILLLMDNAASREQVEPLIPPAGCLLLVTSRFHFALPGMISRSLDELPQEDARYLLLKIAPRIGEESDNLARLCGRLPLALRLAGSVLAERPELSPADYAHRLKEGKEGLGAVDASLTVSYQLLNEEGQRLWRMLAVFPDTFDVRSAAAVWELEIDLASEALAELVRSSLIEWEESEERYRLHELARTFANRKLNEIERTTAQRRASQQSPTSARDRLRVFLCHASDDKPQVRILYQRLKLANTEPWLDEESLVPGQDWRQEIEVAVRAADAVIICLSQRSLTKEGFVQREIKYALDVADEKPPRTIFLIPLRFEECAVPERLGRWNWVDLFEPRGFARLMTALRIRAYDLQRELPREGPLDVSV